MFNKKDHNLCYYILYFAIMNEDTKEFLKQLAILEQEHRDLDDIIKRLQEQKTVNLNQMQRFKKRKLLLKDKIENLKDKIEPDIIA